MEEFDEERIFKFVKGIIDEHYKHIRLHKFMVVEPLHEAEHIRGFEEIGYKDVGFKVELNHDMFQSITGSTYLSPVVMGIGRTIALGELHYFLNELNSLKDINYKNIQKNDFSPKNILEAITDFEEPIILSSIMRHSIFSIDEIVNFFEFKDGVQSFAEIPWHHIPSQFIDEKIFIIDWKLDLY